MLLRNWLARDIEPIELIIDPWLPVGGIAMIYGPRGVSKTNVAMGLALSVAGGLPFLDQPVPRARRVLYVDGEMQRALVKERLAKFMNHTARPLALDNLDYLSYADLEGGIPDLSVDGEGRRLIERAINGHDADLLVMDNKSTLIRGGDENAADSYESINSWLLTLRSFGVTTVIIHHAGKRKMDGSLAQRGSSRIEDVVDGIIQLDTAGAPKDGIVPIKWTFEKCRSFTPSDPSFGMAVCYDDDARLGWLELLDPADVQGQPPEWLGLARSLRDQGKSLRDIGNAVGVSYVTVKRWLDRAGRPVVTLETLGA